MSKQPVKRGGPARDQFVNAILADNKLGRMAMRVGARLGMFLNATHGQCDPGYPTVANALDVSERSVIRAVLELEARGWIEVDRADGRANNKFRLFMIEPESENRVTAVVTPNAGETANRALPVWGDKNASKNGNRVTTAVTQNTEEENTEKEAVGSKNSKRHRRVLTESQSPPVTPVTASTLHVPNPARETAHAARWNPVCLNHEQRPEFSTDASCLDEGRGGFANGGLPIDEANVPVQQLQWIEPLPPPKRSREPQSYFEAAYGDAS
jgi:hypothetical protein